MSWTRREFLTRSAVLGAALATGCTTTLDGAPRAGETARTPTEEAPEREAVTLTVGIVAYQPYTVEQNGEAAGPVPDVARAVLERIGVTEVGIVTSRDEQAILAGVAAGEFDLVGGLTIRPDLCDRLRYSIPDTVSGTALIVPAGNPRGLTTYAEVVATGATVAVLTGAPEQQDAIASGVRRANLVDLPVPHQLVDAVRNGQADCAAFDDITARDMTATLGDGEVVTAAPFPPPRRPPLIGAYGFTPESAGLLERFNTALRELHDSGEWLAMVEPYGFTADNDPPADLRTDRLCGG